LNERVVITGIGMVTALGNTREATWERMLAGECGIRPTELFETEGYRSRLSAEVHVSELNDGLTSLERRRLSRSDQMGVAAASEALADAGLLDGALDRRRVGVVLGAGTADLLRNETFYKKWMTCGIDRARKSDVWNHFSSTPGDAIAHRFGFEGLRSCVVAACSSSTIAIGQAADAIRRGRADAVLAGGADALSRLTFSGFNALRLMDPSPCRPFDRSRAGMSIGEGSAILVLEPLDRARRRGARIYGELAGYSFVCEAFHPTAPEPEGRPVASVIAAALRRGHVDPHDVDHINAHGTATPQNDAAESKGFRRVFGDRTSEIPVTSIKSMIGHCLGAAGAIEAAALAMSIARGVIPPTINHDVADCDVMVVANHAREQRLRSGVSTSLGFGGNDAALVIRAWDSANAN
jgi:3-oxoacyl-[acyl-carrier-protein] synthase II